MAMQAEWGSSAGFTRSVPKRKKWMCTSGRSGERSVFTSAPAVSAQLKALEEELGVRLFDRTRGGLRFTPAGERLLALSRPREKVCRVPASALQTVENRQVVFVRTSSGFRAVPVTVGAHSSGSVVVTSGLTGREEIAGTGSFTLKAELGKGEAEHGH